MNVKNNLAFFLLLFLFLIAAAACHSKLLAWQAAHKHFTYYVSSFGNDKNEGSRENPWQTIHKLNSVQLQPGDSVLFESGRTFNGTILIDSIESGTAELPVVISATGNGKAVIYAGNASALIVNSANYIHIRHLSFTGSGRKEGNTKDGVAIINSKNIVATDLTINGFQKAGLLVYSCSDVRVDNVSAHDNGFAGFSVLGAQAKTNCKNIYISNCRAENNPGDPTNFDNHSGNGIIAGFCKNVIIDHCVATNNGWDMPRTGNGPVGIWCFEADSVTIQRCISYRNKTAAGAADGGGYDLDGGVTNSIIQYCLSYENQGSGFGIFQYAGASDWYNNTVRFNISENDGNVSAARAGVFIWNSSRDDKQFKDLLFYNNVIYNNRGAAISYASESENAGFRFYNNIFVGKDTLVTGIESSVSYLANNWWSLSAGFHIAGIKSFNDWALKTGKEQLKGKLTGVNIDPQFLIPGKTSLTNPLFLKAFFNYRSQNVRLKNNGLELNTLFNIDAGSKDFNEQPLPLKGIGASF